MYAHHRVGCGYRISRHVVRTICLLLGAAACADTDVGPAGGIEEADQTLVVGYHTNSDDPRLVSLTNRLRRTELRWVVGEPLEHAGFLWGMPQSVTQNTRDEFVILDGIMHSLVYLTQDGRVLGSTGREGGGPGEFQGPYGIALGEGNDLVVAQGVGGPVVLAGDSVESIRERFRMRGIPGATGVCTLKGTVYLRVNFPSIADYQVAAIPLTPDGTPTFFAAPSLPQDKFERVELAGGHVACSPEADRIIVTYKDLPYVHSFTPDGKLAWEARIAPFSTVPLTRMTVGGMPAMRRDLTLPSDIVLGSFVVPKGFVLVQVGRLAPRDRNASARGGRRVVRRDTYVFRADTGHGVYAGEDIPHTIFASDSVLLGVDLHKELLTPEVRAYAY